VVPCRRDTTNRLSRPTQKAALPGFPSEPASMTERLRNEGKFSNSRPAPTKNDRIKWGFCLKQRVCHEASSGFRAWRHDQPQLPRSVPRLLVRTEQVQSRFGKEDSNLHRLIQRGADRLAATKTRSILLLFQEIRLFS
jgi:hypothetical protein